VDLIRTIADALTSPVSALADPVEGKTARLLAGCILFVGAMLLLLHGLTFALGEETSWVWPPYGVLGVSYLLSRTRSGWKVGAVLAAFTFPALAWAELISSAALRFGPLAYLLLAPFFAGVFLGVWGAVAFATLNVAGLLSLPVFFAEITINRGILDATIANLMAGAMAISYALRRDWMEQRRKESAQMQEAQLLQMQKMEALGRMAGGIAHDFNNLLTVISGGVDLLARRGVRKKELRLIESATHSAQTLTAQLLTLSRQSVVEHAVCDLASHLARMDRLLARIIGEDVSLKVHVEPHLHHVRLSETQLQQVLLNLATNARDAMPKGGTLEFSAKNQGINQVLLCVSDTGVGMDEATRERVFEPFFTTKSVGKGTGLGLSMVFGVITQAGGEIAVESTLGQGTTFRLLLTRGEPESPPTEVTEQGIELWGRAQGTVLLVEDDSGVRAMCRSVLRREGYDVIDASDPLEAIELFLNHRDEVDLVISDIVMPHMSGMELAEVLRNHRPDLSVLFVSGYAPEDVLGRNLDSRSLLKKPFRPVELLRRVSALLHNLDSQAPPPSVNVQLPHLPVLRSEMVQSGSTTLKPESSVRSKGEKAEVSHEALGELGASRTGGS